MKPFSSESFSKGLTWNSAGVVTLKTVGCRMKSSAGFVGVFSGTYTQYVRVRLFQVVVYSVSVPVCADKDAATSRKEISSFFTVAPFKIAGRGTCTKLTSKD